jgi:hypothetical protein
MSTIVLNNRAFAQFKLYIIPVFTGFIKSIRDDFVDILDHNWWIQCFNEVYPDIYLKSIKDSSTIKDEIFNRVISEYPADILSEEHISILREELSNKYNYYAFSVGPVKNYKHRNNCDILDCNGDCGVKCCRVCIDVCRCKYR